MKVLGIDPGLADFGWAVIEYDKNFKNYKLLSYGEIKTRKEESIEDRLHKIFFELKNIIEKQTPNLVCIESQFYTKIAKSMINTYMALGVVYLVCGLKKIPTKEFSAKTVKVAISGYGSAGKLQIKKMVAMLLGLDKEINSEHINDAISVALCYLTTSCFVE